MVKLNMKKWLIIVLMAQMFFTSAQEQQAGKVLDGDEIEYVVFGYYDHLFAQVNTTVIWKITKTHLLSSRNGFMGFFHPFGDLPCDTLTQDLFEKAQVIKKSIPVCLIDSTSQIFGEEIIDPLKRSVVVEFKRRDKKYIAYIHPTSNMLPEEIKRFYSTIMEVLKR